LEPRLGDGAASVSDAAGVESGLVPLLPSTEAGIVVRWVEGVDFGSAGAAVLEEGLLAHATHFQEVRLPLEEFELGVGIGSMQPSLPLDFQVTASAEWDQISWSIV
jgi:hypothetical protein